MTQSPVVRDQTIHNVHRKAGSSLGMRLKVSQDFLMVTWKMTSKNSGS